MDEVSDCVILSKQKELLLMIMGLTNYEIILIQTFYLYLITIISNTNNFRTVTGRVIGVIWYLIIVN